MLIKCLQDDSDSDNDDDDDDKGNGDDSRSQGAQWLRAQTLYPDCLWTGSTQKNIWHILRAMKVLAVLAKCWITATTEIMAITEAVVIVMITIVMILATIF